MAVGDVANGIGLSIGATTLRAVAVDRSAVTRSPVLTRYPHRPAEVGVPSENPNLAERGLIITDFVDRVGDPVAILAADGSSHRAETVLAEALRALLYALTGGRPPVEPVGVTHPAHWRPAAVQALRGALDTMTEFNGATVGGTRSDAMGSAPVVSDAEAALTALNDEPGLPARGIVALCDVGGTGTSVTLADAADGFRPIGPTVRYPELSGDLIDQSLLTRLVGDLSASGSVDLSGTSAIGSLGRLRGQCRAAKERLSTTTAASVAVDLPGRSTEVRITRTELDETMTEPLAGLIDLIQDSLQRNGIRSGDLAAVASVGGGARIPILTTTLSENLRVPVVTSPRPELASAIGGGLTAVRGATPDGATAMAPAAATGLAAVVAPISAAEPGAPASSTFRALAWSDADDLPEPVVADSHYAGAVEERGYEPLAEPADPRPRIEFTESDEDSTPAPLPWFRKPLAIAGIVLVAALVVIGGAAYYALRSDESPAPESTPTSQTSSTAPPETSEPAPASEAPAQTQEPAPETVIEQAPPPAVTVTEPPPPAPSTEAPPPPTTTEPPPVTVTETQTTQPPASTPTTQQPVIPTLPYQTIPGLPFVPAPVQPNSP